MTSAEADVTEAGEVHELSRITTRMREQWTPPLFSHLRARIAAEAAEDLEPEARFSPAWTAWLYRDLDRGRRRGELAEAEALTTYPEDPAPIASLGLAPFLDWSHRQAQRRRFRKAV